jgi:hypothetical protein
MTAIVCAGCCQSINDASFIWTGAGLYHDRCVPQSNVTPALPALPPGELIGWQWRRTGQPWPEKMLSIEPALTAPETEKRAIYAGPVIPYGVGGLEK